MFFYLTTDLKIGVEVPRDNPQDKCIYFRYLDQEKALYCKILYIMNRIFPSSILERSLRTLPYSLPICKKEILVNLVIWTIATMMSQYTVI